MAKVTSALRLMQKLEGDRMAAKELRREVGRLDGIAVDAIKARDSALAEEAMERAQDARRRLQPISGMPYAAGGAAVLGAAGSEEADAMQMPEPMAMPSPTTEFARRSAERKGRYDGIRQSLLSGAEEVLSNIQNAFRPEAIFDSLEMPQRGLLGVGQGAVSMAQGQPIRSALRDAARVAEQPVEQTAYDVGASVQDATGSPVAATAANVATQMLSPF